MRRHLAIGCILLFAILFGVEGGERKLAFHNYGHYTSAMGYLILEHGSQEGMEHMRTLALLLDRLITYMDDELSASQKSGVSGSITHVVGTLARGFGPKPSQAATERRKANLKSLINQLPEDGEISNPGDMRMWLHIALGLAGDPPDLESCMRLLTMDDPSQAHLAPYGHSAPNYKLCALAIFDESEMPIQLLPYLLALADHPYSESREIQVFRTRSSLLMGGKAASREEAQRMAEEMAPSDFREFPFRASIARYLNQLGVLNEVVTSTDPQDGLSLANIVFDEVSLNEAVKRYYDEGGQPLAEEVLRKLRDYEGEFAGRLGVTIMESVP